MELETKLKISYYKEIAKLDKEHNIKVVQHTESNKIFVQKTLHIYDMKVFSFIAKNSLQGIPKIVELFEDEDTLYVIEEYISGDSIREILDSKGKLSEQEAVCLVSQLCDILRPFHKSNPPFVHRDIKPSNLIVTSSGSLVLIDFNAAKESKTNQTQDTVLIGTAGYAAPEQYGFSSSKPTTDIYAIGVLLNEMLTGRLPNQKQYTGPLQSVIRKCTQMDETKRYQTVDQLQNTLNGIKNPNIKIKRPNKVEPGIRGWLPPGIRSKNPWVIIASSLLYLLIISSCLSINVENTYGFELIAYRVIMLLFFLSLTLLIGNYRNIWATLPLTNSSKLPVRICGIVIWSLVLLLIAAMLLG